jgi:hypothetical protein
VLVEAYSAHTSDNISDPLPGTEYTKLAKKIKYLKYISMRLLRKLHNNTLKVVIVAVQAKPKLARQE